MPGSPLQESLAYSDKITLKYFQYHTTFTSMKETFGYKTPEAWFAHLREWKEELAHPVTVRIKENR